MADLTELQQTAKTLGCPNPEALSEFELHAFIRENGRRMMIDEKDINIFNVFRILNAPDDDAGREQMCDDLFDVHYYHINMGEEYFLVRHTAIKAEPGYQVIKLNPAIPEHHDAIGQVVDVVMSEVFDIHTTEEAIDFLTNGEQQNPEEDG